MYFSWYFNQVLIVYVIDAVYVLVASVWIDTFLFQMHAGQSCTASHYGAASSRPWHHHKDHVASQWAREEIFFLQWAMRTMCTILLVFPTCPHSEVPSSFFVASRAASSRDVHHQ